MTTRTQINWTDRVAQQFLPDGSVIIPPRIAAWLEKKARILPEWRIMLRDSDPEAYAVLMALHISALNRGVTPVPRKVSPSGQPTDETRRRLTESDEQWVTTVEAAEMIGVHARSIRRWIEKQQLPARRHGGRWFVNKQHLNATKALAA